MVLWPPFVVPQAMRALLLWVGPTYTKVGAAEAATTEIMAATASRRSFFHESAIHFSVDDWAAQR